MKKNIVWLASYPKSGNTWFRMFLANYLKRSKTPLDLEDIESNRIASSAIDFEEEIAMNPFEMSPDEVDLYRPDMYRALSKKYEEEGEQVYKKTHDAYTFTKEGIPIFPSEISKSAVCFVRNPLDVCVSYANHSAGKIEKTINLILNKHGAIAGKKQGQLRQILLSWQGHVKSWKNQSEIPVLFVRYEDMLMNPIETFKNIILFLELEYEQDRLEKAILNTDFKILQQKEKEKGFGEKIQECKRFFWKGKNWQLS
nr:sulfotransferase domain-containing protein [uncultured Draconibacterium sp.]